MLQQSARSVIRLRGVRHNNLKNFDLDLPLHQLTVITGLSGSGKSSLAFDTLFAEGQRRYIETFSPYARQFLDRMDKPQVDSIEGIPPAIAIEQRNSVRTTRSTVGTMTEICDYMKLLWPQIAVLYCRQCGRPVRKDSPREIWEREVREAERRGKEWIVTFDLPLTPKLSLQESLALVAKQGYQRLLVERELARLEEVPARLTNKTVTLTVVQDRLRATAANRARFVEACEQAYHFGKGKLAVWEVPPESAANSAAARSFLGPHRYSKGLHCAECDLEYHEPSPALFSFNHPVGACPACRGFGRIISIDYALALPDRSKTLADGLVKPWQTGFGLECQDDLLRMCRKFGVPTDVPFSKLPKRWQDFVIDGEPGYGQDAAHEWPRAWYGIKGYFRWLESRAYKMHVRVLLSRYRAYTPCPACAGKRFQPESLLYRVRQRVSPPTNNSPGGLTLADFYWLPIRDAWQFIEGLGQARRFQPNDPLGLVLGEVRSRLRYLDDVGLGYLTLDRPTRSLSGGETERVSLTTCLGTRLVNTLFVLDEPSVGLHPRDTERLVRLLQHLRDAGNTVVVVEHEPSVMRAADQIVDLGPGHGATGGEVVFQGSYRKMLRAKGTLTGLYLSGRKWIELPVRRAVSAPRPQPVRRRSASSTEGRISSNRQARAAYLELCHATKHNLKNLTVAIPLNRFVCITGVSGSGKTTLVREVLLPALSERLKGSRAEVKASDRLSSENDSEEAVESTGEGNGIAGRGVSLRGWEQLSRVVLVDQSILGKTPRSNPAVYIGAFGDIREFFAQTEVAKQRGLSASAFSFNSSQGHCERCRGAGFEKIEMQFLSDVFIRCPDCDGRRYRAHILDVKIEAPAASHRPETLSGDGQTSSNVSANPVGHGAWSIADVLEATVDEVIDFLTRFPGSRPAQRAVGSLRLLQEAGLGYLKLGQPINTLSGGESQRLKLVSHLAEVVQGVETRLDASSGPRLRGRQRSESRFPNAILYLFDEPTTGLHFDDVRVLLKVLQRLVDSGHSVVVIEHNLELIKSADWVIDLGPEAGDGGGKVVAQGTPETVADCARSHTGLALRDVLGQPKGTLPRAVQGAILRKPRRPVGCD
jgi:excinuclease ABC subunit A